MGRFGKRDDLVVHQEEPFNAETGIESLADPVTGTDAFYVRGHGAVPEINPDVWRLRVEGMVERELTLSLATLREAFRERTVTATLCPPARSRFAAGRLPAETDTWRGLTSRSTRARPGRKRTSWTTSAGGPGGIGA